MERIESEELVGANFFSSRREVAPSASFGSKILKALVHALVGIAEYALLPAPPLDTLV
jgi:hypothetical protein